MPKGYVSTHNPPESMAEDALPGLGRNVSQRQWASHGGRRIQFGQQCGVAAAKRIAEEKKALLKETGLAPFCPAGGATRLLPPVCCTCKQARRGLNLPMIKQTDMQIDGIVMSAAGPWRRSIVASFLNARRAPHV